MRQVTFYERFIKHPMDRIIAIIALILLSPVILIVSLLVMIKLGSPVIFTQDRPGLNEKIFRMYKFRTMTNATDDSGNLLPDSVRLTRFGQFLRSTSLDELPELFNIARGEMSFVGPRPLLVEYLPLYSEAQRQRHSVRPGLTGLAQISGRNAISWETRFELDVHYTQHMSFTEDVRIFLATISKAFIKREGISSENSVTMEPFGGAKHA